MILVMHALTLFAANVDLVCEGCYVLTNRLVHFKQLPLSGNIANLIIHLDIIPFFCQRLVALPSMQFCVPAIELLDLIFDYNIDLFSPVFAKVCSFYD